MLFFLLENKVSLLVNNTCFKGKADQALLAFFECLLFEETISKPLKADIYQSLASFITSVMEEEGGEVGPQ